MNRTTLHTTVLLSIAVLFAGCAVLTIDVDVYKGPLANHTDIQMEQMAAMAIGAKPLLIELRDTLEVGDDYWKEFTKEDRKWYDLSKYLETRLSYLRESSWYQPEYIPPHWGENGKKESRFKSSDADNVNNILYMYEDRGPEEYVRLNDTAFKILSRYRKIYAILRPQNMAEDEALVKEIKQKAEQEVKNRAETRGNEKAAKDPNALDVLNAYKDYLGNNERDALNVVQETLDYLKTVQPKSRFLIELKSKAVSRDIAMRTVTNAAQKLLADTEFVDACADELLELKDTQRDQFVTRVKEIAKAYLDSRAALEDLWLALMDGLVDISGVPVADEREDRCRQKLTAGVVDLSLEIIQPRYLAILLEAETREQILTHANVSVISLGAYPSADPNEPHSMWDYPKMKYVLGERLKKEPVKTATSLKAIHEFCKSALDLEQTWMKRYVRTGHLRGLAYKEGWMFGLVRAPFDELEPDQLAGIADKVFVYGGGAFAGGRLDRGLEFLIEEYLKQANVCDRDDDELQCARQQLSDALVRFAKKLLFLANNRSLISPPRSQGLIIGTLDVLSRGLFGEIVTGGATDYMGWSEAGTRQYTRILQAVGNSIVVQADALHQERIHAEGLEERANTEAAVLRHTLGLSAEKVIDRLIQTLEAEQSSKQRRAREIAAASACAEKKLDELKEELEALSKETEPDEQAKAQAEKRREEQLLYIKSLEEAAKNTQTKIERITATIAEIRDVKFAVLERIEKMDSYAPAGTVYSLVHSTLQQKLEKQIAAGAENEKIERLRKAAEDMKDRPLPMDLKLSDSMLPAEPTAKDVRDVWITLLEYEHDLALRNGDKARAGQILEAIKAARKKREDMIFIRPAMAYLRTSFPATSLQGNPNLTWDNMLGGHAMRSVPFSPQIGEFLDPDAKRDARINAEIDKQFWQNINRVRVAGGGDTNYAVVKDDIGNWYVKGYSANPKDIIESAKNLAMFAAGAPLDTNLLTPSDQVDGARAAPEASSTALESVFDKYRDEYRRKTAQEYSLLCAILSDPNAKIDDQIRTSWHANERIESPSKVGDALEKALERSYNRFLKHFASDLRDDQEDTAIQRERIVEGIRRLKYFQYDLTLKIRHVAVPTDPTDSTQPTDEQVERAKDAARDIVEDVVDGRIDTLLTNRRDAIKTYEGALIFLAEATQQKE